MRRLRGGLVTMTTASPLEWLDVTFEVRRRKAVGRDFRVGPIFTLKSVMDSGQAMRVGTADYHDPLRWWL
jgi:hypothetical protein